MRVVFESTSESDRAHVSIQKMNNDHKIGFACVIATIVLAVIAFGHMSPLSTHDLPSNQVRFLAAVASARSAFQAAPNELSHEQIRKSRQQAICRVLSERIALSWIGEISGISSTSGGSAVLKIKLAPNVHVQTWNNAFSDAGSKTLVLSGTALFASLVPLRRGDAVQFSGSFEESEKDCVKEQSITQAGSMLDPEFTMRFTEVKKL